MNKNFHYAFSRPDFKLRFDFVPSLTNIWLMCSVKIMPEKLNFTRIDFVRTKDKI
jgi:hypothetical protein